MEVLVYDPYLSPEDIRRSGAVPVSLEAGLARADFVSVHIRPTAQTINFVDIDLLRQMKKLIESLSAPLPAGDATGKSVDWLVNVKNCR